MVIADLSFHRTDVGYLHFHGSDVNCSKMVIADLQFHRTDVSCSMKITYHFMGVM